MAKTTLRTHATAGANHLLFQKGAVCDPEDPRWSFHGSERSAFEEGLEEAGIQKDWEPAGDAEIQLHAAGWCVHFQPPGGWRTEFAEHYAVPRAFTDLVGKGLLRDCSWHNDVAPSFEIVGVTDHEKEIDARIWVLHPCNCEGGWREGAGEGRYSVYEDTDEAFLYDGNDAVAAVRTALSLIGKAVGQHLQVIVDKAGFGSLPNFAAVSDRCDAAVLIGQAFYEVVGRHYENGSEEDVFIHNTATDLVTFTLKNREKRQVETSPRKTGHEKLVGQRIQLLKPTYKCIGNSEPDFGGQRGTITQFNLHGISIRLDEHDPNLDEWDNELHWCQEDLLFTGQRDEQQLEWFKHTTANERLAFYRGALSLIGWLIDEGYEKRIAEERREAQVKHVAQIAEEQFWAHVAKSYPQATTGDLGPEETVEFRKACEQAVSDWVDANVKESK
jgi:hypothetical protein